MDVDFEDCTDASKNGKTDSFFKVIGMPLLSCKPFVILLDKAYEFVRCKACLSELDSSGGYYCSEKCHSNDKNLNEIEQIINSSMDTFLPYYDHYNQFMTENDFVCFNKLFFRVLYVGKHYRAEHPIERYSDSFGLNKVTFNEIKYDLNIDEVESPPIPVEELQTYSREYDTFTEEERQLLDKRLNLNIPDDEYFHEEYIQRQVKVTVDFLLDAVQQSFHPFRERRYPSVSFDDEYEPYSSPTNEFFSIDFTRNLSSAFSQSSDCSQLERIQNSLKIYRQQNPDFQTAEIQVDILNEEKFIALHKQAYRISVIDFYLFHAQNTSSGRSKDDKMYGDWVRALRNFIVQNESLKSVLGAISWQDILRAFYVTIRYSIGIQDFLCSDTLAMGVYLPLTNVQHSCKPNCSFIFQDNQLQIFYLPEKQIQIEQNDSEFCYDSSNEIIQDFKPRPLSSYLPLEDRSVQFEMKIDFQSHLLFHFERQYVDKLAEFRLLRCQCQRCIDNEDKENNDDVENDYAFHEFDGFMDTDAAYDNDFYLSSQQLPDSGNNGIIHNNKGDNFEMQIYDESCSCLKFIADAGNNNHDKFCSKIQSVLEDVIFNSRELFGFYHPRTTGFLFYLLCTRFQLILNERNSLILFYKYVFIDRLLDQVQQSVLITHGKNHPVINTLIKIHKICHNNLAEFFVNIRDHLAKFEPTIIKQISLGTMSSENCEILSKIPFSIRKMNWENGQLYDHEGGIIHLEDDSESFSYDQDSSLQNAYRIQGRKRKISESEEQFNDDRKPANDKNNMTTLLNLLDNIFNISNHHYL